MDNIKVIGAREHNLKNVSVEIPKNKLVVFTGVSGSGKSSLVFDTINSEAQRQLIETFSPYARSRLPKFNKPEVDEIRNISPVIVIDQKRMGRTPRSTVGTATEIYNYLRLLYSRIGKPFIGWSNAFSFNRPEGMCDKCKGLGHEITINPDKIIDWNRTLRQGAVVNPNYKVSNWFWKELVQDGLFDPDKKLKDFSKKELNILLYTKALKHDRVHKGRTYQTTFEGVVTKLERLYLQTESDLRREQARQWFDLVECSKCKGTRLNKKARSVKVAGKSIDQLAGMELTKLRKFINKIKGPLANPVIKRVKQQLDYLIAIGVGYLTLNRQTSTLSGGESQRVKMSRQLDCDLVNLIYVLDEPSIGLHPKDIDHLINMLKKLKDHGNSLLIVEHDPLIMSHADNIINLGPGAGRKGGKITFQGTYNELKNSETITGEFLRKKDWVNFERRAVSEFIKIKNARAHNLRNITVNIPKGVFTCVTGVAGSGKSSLIIDEFIEKYPKTILVDQTGVGRSSRSNPLTYTGVFKLVREEFAKATQKDASLFSFNSKGACPKCKGLGELKVEMHFLGNIKVECDECNGKRYNEDVLKLKYEGKNISEVLELTVEQALDFFESDEVKHRLGILNDVGLNYLELGQPLSSLSGGEAQRMKLARELHKKGSVYVMDEPTTGLHMADITKLLKVINQLVDNGNTVIVIEHNLDVIKRADWVIDLGPGGGSKGGEVIATGTPEQIADFKKSFTGQYLKQVL